MELSDRKNYLNNDSNNDDDDDNNDYILFILHFSFTQNPRVGHG